MTRHPDDSVCREGTRDVPPGFTPCCDIFAAHVTTCEYDLRYEWWPEQEIWVVAIAESAGSGGVWISHCPHCGRLLQPPSHRAAEAEARGGQPGRWLRIG